MVKFPTCSLSISLIMDPLYQLKCTFYALYKSISLKYPRKRRTFVSSRIESSKIPLQKLISTAILFLHPAVCPYRTQSKPNFIHLDLLRVPYLVPK